MDSLICTFPVLVVRGTRYLPRSILLKDGFRVYRCISVRLGGWRERCTVNVIYRFRSKPQIRILVQGTTTRGRHRPHGRLLEETSLGLVDTEVLDMFGNYTRVQN